MASARMPCARCRAPDPAPQTELAIKWLQEGGSESPSCLFLFRKPPQSILVAPPPVTSCWPPVASCLHAGCRPKP